MNEVTLDDNKDITMNENEGVFPLNDNEEISLSECFRRVTTKEKKISAPNDDNAPPPLPLSQR
jgi:hypothetical protein